ncbi:hypothetical protein CspeluHIS016_0700410 [Cutaneotrichosporon spelunceum]|uniref:WD40 repeat-like protein n=1 Tax=Cutaneotrichosporon spelunceum TaxID=1672016 RepID=A0AAD3TYS3_9TREE|nr:hypothetical protein CspeluHIS016_0700410 [Cutaneotrichosporon spelunceum]
MPSTLHPARAHALPARPYIVDIVPARSHLALRHPEPEITLADRETLQGVLALSGHSAPVTAVCADSSIWSAGKDARVVRWDERTRRPAAEITAHLRKPLPLSALALNEQANLVVGGTECVSSESHILFWDVRQTSSPVYRHSSTHSDEITHLSFLPSLPSLQSGPSGPSALLLSASVDGTLAVSDVTESDEEEAVHAAANWNASIAGASVYTWSGGARVWARSDMDTLASWALCVGEEGLELSALHEVASAQFKARDIGGLRTEYLVTAAPSLGVGPAGAPVVAAGTNDGAVVLEYNAGKGYEATAVLRGAHEDVVRCLYHAPVDGALYTGSEDGVLAGWAIGGLALQTGADGERDERGERESQQNEHKQEAAEMDVDTARDTRERQSRKEKRQRKRHAPY